MLRKIHTTVTYIFFPGTFAIAGFAVLASVFRLTLPWHFWPVVIFCFAVFPVIGLWFLIRLGVLKDLHVYDRKLRNKSYPLAIAGTALGLLYLELMGSHFTPSVLQWALAINIVLIFVYIINGLGMKISAHGAGAGGFLALISQLYRQHDTGLQLLGLTMLITVVVYLARRGLSAHSHIELILGTTAGFITTFAIMAL